MQPILDQQKLKALVYYIEVPACPSQTFLVFLSFSKVLLNYLPGIRDPVKKFLVSLRDWPVSKYFELVIICIFKINVHTGADGVQLTTSHTVQEEGGGAGGTSPTLLQNPNRVARLQRQQSAIQRIPLFALVVS